VAGFRNGDSAPEFAPRHRSGPKSLREAIGDLDSPAFFSRSLTHDQIPVHPNHWTMQPRSPRFAQDVSKWKNGRSFRRTFWDKPSPTIAFGHREIHIHPNCARRLSIFEAMLLQGFPMSFVLKGTLSQQAEMVSNAVPPPLARSVALAVKRIVKVLPE